MSPTPFYTPSGQARLSAVDRTDLEQRLDRIAADLDLVCAEPGLSISERMTWQGRAREFAAKHAADRASSVAQLVAGGYLTNLEGALTRWHERRAL